MTEKDAWTINGYLGIVILAVMAGVGILSLFNQEWVMAGIFLVGMIVLGSGLTVIHPKQSVIVQFAGNYAGTYRETGIVMFIPFSKRIRISLKERIFKMEMMHVHDKEGIPRNMSMVLLLKIVDAAKAVYDVEDLEKYISIQSEMSARNLMIAYAHQDLLQDEVMKEATDQLQQNLFDRLDRVGLELIEINIIPTRAADESGMIQDPAQLTERVLRLFEKEKLLSLNHEKRQVLKNKLTISLSGE